MTQPTPTSLENTTHDLIIDRNQMALWMPFPPRGTAGNTQYVNLAASSLVANVKNFGAAGDGVTNDAPAIQLAISLAAAVGGGTVFFPPGTYYLGSGPLFNTSSLSACSGVYLQGAGVGLSTLTANGALTGGSADLVRITVAAPGPYAQNVHISDLTLDCSAQTAGNGMTLQGIDYLRVERVQLIKPFGYGITVGSAGSTPYVKSPLLQDIVIFGERNGNDGIGGGGIIRGHVTNYWAVPAADGTNLAGTAIDWTNVQDTDWDHIYALNTSPSTAKSCMATDFGAVGLRIGDCTIDGFSDGIVIASTSSGQASDISIRDVTMRNIYKLGVFFNTAATYGIPRLSVRGCDIESWDGAASAYPAIEVEGGTQIEIANNRFGSVSTAYAITLVGEAGSVSSGAPTYLNVHDNDVSQPTNKIFPDFVGVPCHIHDNPGYNPKGTITVSVPLSTNATTALPYDAFVTPLTVSGATYSLSNGGTGTFVVNVPVFIPAGVTVTPTYTTLTWSWKAI